MMLKDDLENPFDQVYLASGDWGLGPFAQALITEGVAVEVVSAPWSLSNPYRFLGAEVSYLWPDCELEA